MATKRERIAGDLRSAIATGDLSPGDKLPVENELMEHYDVSRSTVRWAMARLREEALISIEQGRGTFVSTPDEHQDRIPRYSPDRLNQTERDANRGAHLHDAMHRKATVDTRVYFERASAATAEVLGIELDDEVVVRDRTMSINGATTQLATSRLPREITRGTQIEDSDTGPGGLLARLQDLGFTLARPVERVTVHRATAHEAHALGVTIGDPILHIVRTQPDKAGQVLEVNDMALIGRYELVYEIPTE